MPNSPASSPSGRPTDCCAEVRSGGQVMRYRRSGAGPVVLLLRPVHTSEPIWPELADRLAARFRVITPELPASLGELDSGEDAASWVADFVEGLGVGPVAVVAVHPMCMAALELALRGASQFARVALVPSGMVGQAVLDGAIDAAAGVTVPLLVVRRTLPIDQALPLVTRFLDGDTVHVSS